MDQMRCVDEACCKSETQLFESRKIQTDIDRSSYVDIHPIGNLSSGGPVEFYINSSGDEYLDLNDTMLRIVVNVKNANTNLTETDLVGPTNNWLHSMWSDVSLTLGDRQVEGGTFTYPQRAYLHNLLTYNEQVKRTQLICSGWQKDTHSKMDDAQNAGWKKRENWVRGGKSVELCGPLILDMFLQNRLLINNVDVRIKLTPSKTEFHMMSLVAGNGQIKPKVTIESAVLFVRRVKIAPHIILENEKQMETQNALYPVQRTEVMTYTIPNGNQSHNKESLFRGFMPKLVIVGLVDNAGFNGTLNKNPFNFEHSNLNHIALYREGDSIPGRALTPDYTNDRYTREYLSLYQALELYTMNESIDITHNEFKNGFCLYAFNLCADMSVSGHSQPYRSGNLRLETKFSTATTKTINVIVMAVFDGLVEITKHRQVVLDYKT